MQVEFIAALSVVLLVIAYFNRSKSANEYFIADRKSSRLLLVTSYLSTSIGGGTLIALVAVAYLGGFAALYLGISYAIGLLVLATVAGKIRKLSEEHSLFSLSDFTSYFFNSPRLSRLITFTVIFSYLLFLAAQFSAISIFFNHYLSIDKTLALCFLAILITGYSAFGGLKVDIKTDLLQFILMAIIIGLFVYYYVTANVKVDFESLEKEYITGEAYSGGGFLVLSVLMLGPSVAASMDVWQRVISSERKDTATSSLIYAAVLLIIIFAFFSYTGILAYQLYPDISATKALLMVADKHVEIMPGLVMLLALASITSTADSMIVAIVTTTFNSGVSRNTPSMRKIRMATLTVGLLGLLLALYLEDLVNLILNAFTSLAILLPATFLPLIIKVREEVAFYSILSGLLFAGAWLMIEPSYAFIPAVVATAVVFIMLSATGKHRILLSSRKDN